jgi:hypothetical protein
MNARDTLRLLGRDPRLRASANQLLAALGERCITEENAADAFDVFLDEQVPSVRNPGREGESE